MNVKIDTKEIFHVITLLDKELTANMSASLQAIIAKTQVEEEKSLILDFSTVLSIDEGFALSLIDLSTRLYADNKSFVICSIQEDVKKKLSSLGLLEKLNSTPTASEAWDIVQMEEIERELGSDFSE